MTKQTTSMNSDVDAAWEREMREMERLQEQSSEGAELARPTKSEQTPWEEVVKVLNIHYHRSDIQAVRALYAGVAAHDLLAVPR